MANTTIKISQLPDIGNNLSVNTLLPVVDTSGLYTTDKVSIGNVANYILTESGNTLPEAFVSQFAYSVTNAAQPNITSVGTLNINTLHISGGTNGYVLQTDGTGNLNWTAMSGAGNGSPGGANSQIQFNNSGLFDGTADLTWDANNTQLNTVNFSAVTATINDITATGNVITSNLETDAIFTNDLNASGNVSVTGNITASFFIGNGSALTGITATASGAGPNTAVQYNSDGIFAGNSNFTYDAPNSALSVPNILSQNIQVVNTAVVNDVDVSGNIQGGLLVSADYLSGDGSNITNIGNATFAENSNIANTASVANSVAVGNVVGIGNIAVVSLDGNTSNILYGNGVFASAPVTYGNSNVTSLLSDFGDNVIVTTGNVEVGNIIGSGQALTDLPGANVTGEVGYAAVANSVAGGNVSGEVGYAAVANSVSVSNVSGIGNISTITLDGNANNVLSGTGAFVPLIPVNVNATGNITAGGNLDVDGEATIGGNLTIVGNITFSGGGSITEVTSAYGNFYGNADGSNALYAGYPGGVVVPGGIASFTGDSNSYMQINAQNRNHGTQASIEYVITGDLGTDTTDYIDLGFTGSSWDGTQENSLGNAVGARDGYLYVQGGGGGGNLTIGTTTSGTTIKFVTGGPNTGNIRAVISNDGLHSGAVYTDNYYYANGDPLAIPSGNTSVSTTGNVTAGNVSTTGNVSAGYLKGDGGNISNIQGGNVSGAVGLATYASTANAVAGGNVLGQVSYAAVANSVAVGNVSGLGNIATINKDGNSSNILYGNGVFAGLTAGTSLVNGNSNVTVSANANVIISTNGNLGVMDIGADGRVRMLTGQKQIGGNIANSEGYIQFTTGGLTYFGGNVQLLGGGYIKGPAGVNVIQLNSPENGSARISNNFAVGSTGTGNITAGNATFSGNVTANNFSGNISITGNVTGTSANVTLVAGSYSYLFDNTGTLTLPAGSGAGGADEGGQINFNIGANSALSGPIALDQYANRMRIFETTGTNRGVYVDLTQAGAGVTTLLNNRISGYVNAGTYVTMDNLKATVTTSGNRSLALASVSGSFVVYVTGMYTVFAGGTGGTGATYTVTTSTGNTPAINWNFGGQGDTVTYVVNDTTNSRVYRITLIIGSGYNNNVITIERLI